MQDRCCRQSLKRRTKRESFIRPVGNGGEGKHPQACVELSFQLNQPIVVIIRRGSGGRGGGGSGSGYLALRASG
jgi:hypothetical protein